MSDQVCRTDGPGISVAEVEEIVHGICFKTGPPAAVGVEVEWLLQETGQPSLPLSGERLDEACRALRALDLSSPLTVEPGGQLELSSLPAPALTDCVRAVSADLTRVRDTLATLGLSLAGLGANPWCAPRRLVHAPRYDAMEAYLDRAGPDGRGMMCASASVQVCLDAGHEEPGPLGHARRWLLAHRLGPVLVAAFANSPVHAGRLTGWRSTRQAFWAGIEPGRSAAPDLTVAPRTAWTRRVLDAPVMCVREEAGPWSVPEGLTFRDWAAGAGRRPPTRADLDYHLTTLFPPVRPRGHLELRMIDAQPGEDGWIVPFAVTTALFDDPAAAETAYRTVKPLAERYGEWPAPHNALWECAARDALTDPELHEAAVRCFTAALDALPRLGAGEEVLGAVREFIEHRVLPGRCPADDLIESFTVHGKDALR
ncbi:ergothioneine biosynthesis glutamate--cysteine ligase EgtA [Streptomyces sp. NA04227]|uniref:ergothioneine biosynthesis glutamate--cysteine ligase EgtA n=1 Tax=Streptomyces sp. NA04227 TaxID=2742136 RepID=UPI0015905E03|nr:ergothioneine biosynthesis glutamate--cysteine ligase EgtA [Streptomyces sp. NA04227]QKW10339.1 ergothioneine biosynthesis glutamate--cysteine ligase EgtA [Streptomyces sp. NA04227]